MEFSNRTFHRNITVRDEYGLSMAQISTSGVVLASKGQATEEEDYEDDEVNEGAVKKV